MKKKHPFTAISRGAILNKNFPDKVSMRRLFFSLADAEYLLDAADAS